MSSNNITIDIDGPDGNAFAIIGIVTREFRKSGMPQHQIDRIVKKATSGDYEHLKKTLKDEAARCWIFVDYYSRKGSASAY